MQIKELVNNKNNKYQKINGVVYTPEWIVKSILDFINYNKNIYDKKIIDPSCGEGAFLKTITEILINDAFNSKKNTKEVKSLLENNIYGFDIDEIAVDRCKYILTNIANRYNIKNIKWNIIKTNSLDKKFISKFFGFFDFVVGNPPYIRIQNLGVNRREKIQNDWDFSSVGSTDIFITFFELGYKLLNNNGRLGYITPNTYLKTKAGRILRNFIKFSKSLEVLVNFGHNQVFDNATTYSLITILNKKHNNDLFSLYEGDKENIYYIDEININTLKEDNWILKSNKVLSRVNLIEKRGIPLEKIAKIHVGITTLADDYYIFKDPILKSNTAIIALKDGRNFEIEKNILKPIIKVSTLKNSEEDQRRFIIFPYKKKGGKHIIISEEELKEKFPLTMKYFLEIKDILNNRDRGKPNPVSWYAFGRSQGLDTSFGKKILTSPINLKPNFIVWEKEDYTFYAGYCIKFDGDLNYLANQLNSKDMEFYINHTSRDYQNNYKSFSKTFISKFAVKNIEDNLNKRQTLLFGS